jgi:hypothetical protein
LENEEKIILKANAKAVETEEIEEMLKLEMEEVDEAERKSEKNIIEMEKVKTA